MPDRHLDRALRKTGVISNHLVADVYFSRPARCRSAPKIKVNDKRRRFLIMANKVWHQSFHDVGIESQRFHSYGEYYYSNKGFY
jgi:hypothetical protein